MSHRPIENQISLNWELKYSTHFYQLRTWELQNNTYERTAELLQNKRTVVLSLPMLRLFDWPLLTFSYLVKCALLLEPLISISIFTLRTVITSKVGSFGTHAFAKIEINLPCGRRIAYTSVCQRYSILLLTRLCGKRFKVISFSRTIFSEWVSIDMKVVFSWMTFVTHFSILLTSTWSRRVNT